MSTQNKSRTGNKRFLFQKYGIYFPSFIVLLQPSDKKHVFNHVSNHIPPDSPQWFCGSPNQSKIQSCKISKSHKKDSFHFLFLFLKSVGGAQLYFLPHMLKHINRDTNLRKEYPWDKYWFHEYIWKTAQWRIHFLSESKHLS